MLDSTVAVHTKGLGSSFQAARNSRIAFFRSPTLKKAPRRIHCRVDVCLPQAEMPLLPDLFRHRRLLLIQGRVFSRH